MNCTSELRVIFDSPEKCVLLEQLFQSEDRELSNKRARYELKQENAELVFLVTADDCVALRAVLSSITRSLSIFEKTANLVSDSKEN